MQTCVVPGPAAVASKPLCSSSTPQPGATSHKVLHSRPPSAASSKPSDQKHEKPPEDTVPVPPAPKTREVLLKTAEGPPPRGPLSYDALVHLRKSPSTKKTPLCPTVDHTIASGSEPTGPVEGFKPGSDRLHSQPAAAKRPPPVAPKPKIIQPSGKSENEGPIPSGSFHGLKGVANPEVVRLEALQKLGLLKETEADRDTLGPLPPPKSHSFLHPKPSRSARGPSRSPSFPSPQARSGSENKALRSPAGFQQPVCAGLLERSATKQTLRNGGSQPEARPYADSGSATAPPRTQNTSNTVGYTVMVVPGMGADRKEALRKLGLLKN